MVLHFAKVGIAVPSNQKESMESLLESAKTVLRSTCLKLIQEAGALPVLVSYSNDGTSVKAKFQHEMRDLAGVQTQSKTGSEVHELLAQNTFVRYLDIAGQAHSGTMVREPTPLRHGKSGNALFACQREFMLVARDEGHRGIAIQHLV